MCKCFFKSKNSNPLQSRFEGVVYPEEYGGEYLDGNELYIYLVDANERMILEYNILTDYASSVHYLNADYSLDYLESLNSIVDEFCDDYNISSYGVDRKNNRFVIRVYDATSDSESTSSKTYGGLTANETISELSSLINNPAIVFEVQELSEVYASLYGGQSINSSTLGIGGTYNGKNAILLAGHSVNPNGNMNSSGVSIYNSSGVKIAETAYTVFYNGCVGDFAIALCESGYTPTNKVYGSSSSVYRQISGIAYTSATPVGTTVYKYGASEGYAVGTVSYINQTVTYKPVTTVQVSGLNFFTISLSSGYDTDTGDSGGPVYIYSSGAYKLVGTISGGPASNSSAQYSKTIYYSPIYYAEYAGFTVKTN